MKILFICNPQQRTFFDFPEIVAISSQEELDNAFEQRPGSRPWQGIVIMAELLWANTYYSDFYGLEIASELRSRHREAAPILVTSYFPHLEEDSLAFLPFVRPNFKCFFDPNIRFVPLRTFHSVVSVSQLADLFHDPGLRRSSFRKECNGKAGEQAGHFHEVFRSLSTPLELLTPSAGRALVGLVERELAKLRQIFPEPPSAAGFFSGSMLDHYQRHRRDQHYDEEERRISEFALRYVRAVQAGSGALSFFERLPNLQSKLNSSRPERNLKNFRSKLKARRIAIGLCQLPDCHLAAGGAPAGRWRSIYALLNTNSLQAPAVSNGTFHSFFSSLQLSIKADYKFPEAENNGNLTPEEQSWLQKFGPGLAAPLMSSAGGKRG